MKRYAQIISFIIIEILVFKVRVAGQTNNLVEAPDRINRISIGPEFRSDENVLGLEYERSLGSRISFNPGIGLGIHRNSPVLPGKRLWYYTAGIKARFYFLFHESHRLEGAYLISHLGYFRGNEKKQPEGYTYYRFYRTELGLGIGVQKLILNRISIDGNFSIPWTDGTDWLGNPDGSTRLLYRRTGFIFILSLKAGYIF